MMRSLWTAASGMSSQQMKVDTISNNLANVNTFGFKKERLEFKSLLYDTMQRANLDPANQTGRPVNLQVGSGVRPIATTRIFSPGNLQRTEHQLDFAIQGDAFFAILREPDVVAFTKDGSFKVSPTDEGLMIVTSEGFPVLGVDGEPLIIPDEVMVRDLVVQEDGSVGFRTAAGTQEDLGIQIDLVQFSNPQGLEAVGANLFMVTPSSGEPVSESDGEVNRFSMLMQGVLEMSNVQVANEMVNLIVAQRAYELNSRAIQASDEMLQQANQLRR